MTSALHPPRRRAAALPGATPKDGEMLVAPGDVFPEPCGAGCPQSWDRQERVVPKPCLKETGTFPVGCTRGRWVGAGDSCWERVNSVLVPIRTCPAPRLGHALGVPASWQLVPSTASPPPALRCPQHLPSPTSLWQRGDPLGQCHYVPKGRNVTLPSMSRHSPWLPSGPGTECPLPPLSFSSVPSSARWLSTSLGRVTGES